MYMKAYLSVSTHHHLFASKHDVGGSLQAKSKRQIMCQPDIYSDS